MVLGLGIDIIEIVRVKKSIEKYGDKFLSKVFTEGEINYCDKKFNKYQHHFDVDIFMQQRIRQVASFS